MSFERYRVWLLKKYIARAASRPASVPGGGRSFPPLYTAWPVDHLCSVHSHAQRVSLLTNTQKENEACNSIRRLEAELENGPPASALDSPKSGEVRFPIGVARFTWFNTFLAFTLKVKL
jgi:hypothetical protein